jgi:hypothetical protein
VRAVARGLRSRSAGARLVGACMTCVVCAGGVWGGGAAVANGGEREEDFVCADDRNPCKSELC